MRRRPYLIPLLVLLAVLGIGLVFHYSPHKNRPLSETVPAETFTLRNGMKIVVLPNHRIPAVAHILFVKAGAIDDPQGKSGLAHYCEHLMFTGTAKYPEGVYDHTIARLGGEQNAYTTRDFTAYYVLIAKEQLGTVMDLESDRLGHLTLDPARGARELKVITEERNMRVENNPGALLAEQLDAITLLNHPYRQPLIGWPTDMASFTVADARAFYQRFYRPSNIVLVVAGDVDPRQVRKMAEQHYGLLPATAAVTRSWPAEPPLRLTRHAEMVDEKAKTSRMLEQYIAPSLNSGDVGQVMPLSLFAQYLGGGQTSFLYQKLVVEQKVASGIDADYDGLLLGPGMFRVSAVPAPGVSLEQLETALNAALDEALKTPPPADDVARAKTGIKAEMVFAQDGLADLGQLIGALYMIGKDEQYFYSWPALIDSITPEQMQQAAQAVLSPARRTTGYLKPLHEGAPGETDETPMEDAHVR